MHFLPIFVLHTQNIISKVLQHADADGWNLGMAALCEIKKRHNVQKDRVAMLVWMDETMRHRQ